MKLILGIVRNIDYGAKENFFKIPENVVKWAFLWYNIVKEIMTFVPKLKYGKKVIC